jgi:hypothetical protein
MAAIKRKRNVDPPQYKVKKCPYCMVYMKLDAQICDSCKQKIGKVNRLGFAQKPFNWKGYGAAVFGIVIFIAYMWWAFFSRK